VLSPAGLPNQDCDTMKSPLLGFFCTAGLMLSLGAVRAQSAEADTHILATKSDTAIVGCKFTTETVSVMEGGTCTFTSEEGEIEGKGTFKNKEAITLECLSPTRFRRVQTTMEGHTHLEILGETVDQPGEVGVMTGVPVILEKQADGSTYTATLEKGEATAEQRKELEQIAKQAASRDDLTMYGEQPRKPGDKWDVDVTKLSDFADGSNLRGKMTVEFVEVKEFAGVRCAVLKNTFDLSGTIKDDGSGEGKMTLKGEELLHRSLVDRVNLDSKSEGRMTISTKADDMPMKLDSPMLLTIRGTLVKP
jgi:hypothetical protein